MLYPKRFYKEAGAEAVLEELTPQAISYLKRLNKLNNIVHADAAPAMPTQQDIDAAAEQQGGQPLYAYHNGKLYPSVFGYSIPAELVPRRIAPILENLPDIGA